MILRNFKNYLLIILAVFFLNSCKVNLDGDVYIGDIIDVAETGEKLFNPMDISFEMSSVDSCEEDKSKLSLILEKYFSNFKVKLKRRSGAFKKFNQLPKFWNFTLNSNDEILVFLIFMCFLYEF